MCLSKGFSPKNTFVVNSLEKAYSVWYQCFVVIEESECDYRAKLCINACSYNGAGKFTDNNMAYIGLRDVIFSMTGEKITFLYDSTVLFTNQNNNISNYVAIDDLK